MFLHASVRRGKTAAKAAVITLMCAALPVYSQSVRDGAAKGAQMCLTVLIPSLFPMMAVTDLFVTSGLCERVGRLLQKPARLLFGVSGALAPVILMSVLGGYPVGAGGIAALRRQNAVSEEDAQRAALWAVCAGPGFVLNFVGAAVYHSEVIGRIMFISQVASVLLTGAAARFIFPIKKDTVKKPPPKPMPPFDQALVEAVYGAVKGMTAVCGFVTLFAAFLGLLSQLIPNKAALDTVVLFSEVCTAVTTLAPSLPVTSIAFAVGFGGLCVQLQVLAALDGVKVNKPSFFLFRMIQGGLTALFTFIGLKNTPQTAAVFSTADAGTASVFGGSVLSGAALFAVSVCFLISVKQINQNK